MIRLVFEIENMESAFDLLTEIELATSDESIVQQCEEQRDALANSSSEKVAVPHGTKREILYVSKNEV
jgi:hypothetical protein